MRVHLLGAMPTWIVILMTIETITIYLYTIYKSVYNKWPKG